VIQNVSGNDGAIGYAATFPARKESGVVVATIDGHASTNDLVQNNTYHFWNVEHMYTKGKPKDLAQALIDYMSSPDGKAAAAKLRFISINDREQAALQARQPAPPWGRGSSRSGLSLSGSSLSGLPLSGLSRLSCPLRARQAPGATRLE